MLSITPTYRTVTINDVIAEATNTVASGLRNMVAGGGLQNFLSLFTHKEAQGSALQNNPIVNMMKGHFMGKLMSKFNLNSDRANAVAGGLIPNVISHLINRTNDPGNQHFSLPGLLNSITGGRSTEVEQEQQNSGNTGFNFQDLIQQFAEGQQNNNNGGLMDIVSKLAGGAQTQQQRNGGGGLLNLIKGFIK